MKTVRPFILSNGVSCLQMRSVGPNSSPGRGKEGNKERTGEGKESSGRELFSSINSPYRCCTVKTSVSHNLIITICCRNLTWPRSIMWCSQPLQLLRMQWTLNYWEHRWTHLQFLLIRVNLIQEDSHVWPEHRLCLHRVVWIAAFLVR